MKKTKYKVIFKGIDQHVFVTAWTAEQAIILAKAERIGYGANFEVTGYEELD